MTAPFRAPEVIAVKRDGGELDDAALRWFITGYLSGEVNEGQMAALLMAGVIRGFSEAEARALTAVLVESGDVLDLSSLSGPTADKHSTGGVGDGTTLLVAPLLASAGVKVVKLSGRGLGHTGGTLDKLESIPGMRTALDESELLEIADRVGCVVGAQSEHLVPADRELYALRDVTGTVASPALIASSVMSKKIASGAGTIVLDVKAGDGAFMATTEDAVGLAELCVAIGTEAGRRCTALVTGMDTPLGRGIGNGLEVAECVTLLQSAPAGRLAELSLELAAASLALATGADTAAARATLEQRWRSGAALERLRQLVEAQGGNPAVCDDPAGVLPSAAVIRPVRSDRHGYLVGLPAKGVGLLASALGAGRSRKGDDVDPAVGIDLHVDLGAQIGDDPIATVHARHEEDAEQAAARLLELVEIGDEPGRPVDTVRRRVG